MFEKCRVSLFRHEHSQTIRIPREFELEGTQAIFRKAGQRLIIEPLPTGNCLLTVLAELEPLDEALPEFEDAPVQL